MLSDVEAATKLESNAAIEARRANDRERKERQRHGTSRDITGQDVTSRDKVSPKKETSPTPPKEKTTPSNFPSTGAREFAEFWSLFPNKVGKRDAEKVFASALQRASFEAIMTGLRRYVAKTDDRPWCNPATFLNQDRWADQPAAPVPPRQSTAPPKPKTIGDVFREDAKQMGLIPNDEPYTPPKRMAAGDRSGEGGGPGIARRFALPSNILGELG